MVPNGWRRCVDTLEEVLGGHEDHTGSAVRASPFFALVRMGVTILSCQEGVQAPIVDMLFAAKHPHWDGPVFEILKGSQLSADGGERQVLQFVGLRQVILETDHTFVFFLILFLELLSPLRPLFLLSESSLFDQNLVLVLLVELV